jgi:oxidase EvaA
MKKSSSNTAFLISSLSKGLFYSIDEILQWIERKRNETSTKIEKIAIKDLEKWIFDEENIRHTSGHFFSINGIKVETNLGIVSR